MGRLIFVLLTILLAFGYYTVYSNHMRARVGGLLTGCKSNLKNIGFALEDYRKHHNGIYPDSLSKLTPIYLQAIPAMPGQQEKCIWIRALIKSGSVYSLLSRKPSQPLL